MRSIAGSSKGLRKFDAPNICAVPCTAASRNALAPLFQPPPCVDPASSDCGRAAHARCRDEHDAAASLPLSGWKWSAARRVVAFDGRTAIEAAATFVSSVVVIDLDMPFMSGLAAAPHLLQLHSEAKRPWLVALTANTNLDLAERTRRAGFDFYLPKPADLPHVLSIVTSLAQRESLGTAQARAVA